MHLARDYGVPPHLLPGIMSQADLGDYWILWQIDPWGAEALDTVAGSISAHAYLAGNPAGFPKDGADLYPISGPRDRLVGKDPETLDAALSDATSTAAPTQTWQETRAVLKALSGR